MELLFLWIVMGIVVAMIAGSKGLNALAWFVYGALIWPIALVHVLLRPRPQAVEDRRRMEFGESRKCPHCAELIRAEAKLCRFCHQAVEPVKAAPPPRPRRPLEQGDEVEHGEHGYGMIAAPPRNGVALVRFERAGAREVPTILLKRVEDSPNLTPGASVQHFALGVGRVVGPLDDGRIEVEFGPHGKRLVSASMLRSTAAPGGGGG